MLMTKMTQITPDYKPTESGQYLIRTITTIKTPIRDWEREHFFVAHVTVHENGSYSIDVNNQIPTHILNTKYKTMKLLFCKKCEDVFRLTKEPRQCQCGSTKGRKTGR